MEAEPFSCVGVGPIDVNLHCVDGLEAMLTSFAGVQQGAHVPLMPKEDAAEAGGHDAHLAS